MRALKDGQIRDVDEDEVDVALEHPSRLVGTHVNQISMQNAVAAPRLFYGARFYNQAESLTNPESPLVRTLSDDGTTFEKIMGERLGAIRSKRRGIVREAKDGLIILDDPETGESEEIDLYDNFLFNRKSGISQKPVVKPGDAIEPGALLAVSNYTDGEGNAALGLNARVGFVAYNGHSMDDALVVSESFAKRMVGKRLYAEELEKDKDTRTGKGHFTSLFPTDYTKDQLDHLDDEGFAKPGSILKEGDPYALATRPMRFSSNSGALGKLSRTMRTMRQNASKVWEREDPGVVIGTHKTKNGVKVVLSVESPLKPGDKVVERHGAKGIVSLIIPDDRMPRTEDGQPLEVLANFLGLPSRVNDATLLDAILGKVAKATGKPYELPAFNGPNESWLDFVEGELAKNGLKGEEWVFDPAENRRLDRPVPVGYANFMKLHHAAEDKANMRGQGSYDQDELPVQGGSAGAQSKRLSTLELAALMSHSAYETMKEGATLRGAKCFDDKTEVLTRRGWIFWKDVLSDDQFYTRDEERSFFESAELLHSYEYEGQMFGYESRYLDWLVTPDHQFVVRKFKSSSTQRLSAEQVHANWALQVPQFGWPEIGGLEGGTPVVIGGAGYTYRCTPITMSLLDYARFMGWYLSEGSCVVDVLGRGRTVLAQRKEANPDVFFSMLSFCRRVFGKEPQRVRATPAGVKVGLTPGEAVGLRINSRPLADHCALFGKGCDSKTIPRLILDGCAAVKREFLDAYIEGDGCVRNGEWPSVVTTSKDIADGIQAMAVQLGLRGIVYPIKKHKSLDGLPRKPQFHICVGQTKGWATVSPTPKAKGKFRHGYTEIYKGPVYCATMRTGLLYVRRNGKPMWSGNCDNYWRALRQGQVPPEPGTPMVWPKFLALLGGSGYMARDLGKGTLRLGAFTDRDLDALKPSELKNGRLVDPDTLEPEPGGLFDPVLVGNDKWAKIPLPRPVPNPSFEKQIALLLGIREKDVERLATGEITLEEAQR